MIRKFFKIYGADGHRQKETFNHSSEYCFESRDVACIRVHNFDATGTHLYSLLEIHGESIEAIEKERDKQISDGIFENCIVGVCESVQNAEAIGIINGLT